MNASKPAIDADYSIRGMRIQKLDPPEPWALVVRSAKRQSGWTPAKDESLKIMGAEPVPATLMYEGRGYRIGKIEQSPTGWTYYCRLAREGETWLNAVTLSAESMVQDQLDRESNARREKQEQLARLYEIFIGFLPGRMQNELAERWNFSPVDASRLNGMAEFFIGLGGGGINIALVFAEGLNSGEARMRLSGLVFVAMMIDGFLRWFSCLHGEKPMGLYLLEGADWLKLRLAGAKRDPGDGM